MSTAVKTSGSRNGVSRVGRREAESLDIGTASGPIAANLRTMETLYLAAMLEEARVFVVVDRLAAMFSTGLVPLSSGPAAGALYRFWKSHSTQLTTAQRHTVYARAFGLPGGEPGVLPNREFDDLWLRFLGTLGMYSAELQALPATARSVTTEEVRRAGWALAVNLSRHGTGLSAFAATDLKEDLALILEILSDAEVQKAFGAGDRWQLVECLAADASARRPNIHRSRIRAENGPIIIRWLANHRNLLARPGAKILRESQIRERRVAVSYERRQNNPTDFDLVNACERWLSVTGTQDAVLSN
jgi:hypothetical protein